MKDQEILKEFGTLGQKFDTLGKEFGKLDQKLSNMDKQLVALDKTVNVKVLPRLIDLDEFVTEHVATKQGLAATRNEMIGHIQGFAKSHNDLAQEQTASFNRANRLEDRTSVIEKHVGLSGPAA